MKKISIIISALAVVFCSCSKEQDARLLISDQDTNVVSFKAFFEGEDPETKLGINTSSGVLNWANGDAIAVQMTDDTFVPFTYSSSTKEFSATLGDKEVKDGGVAYYPASIAINGTPGSVNLPTSYTIGADATVCPPMIATVNLGAKALSLKHLGGILSVKVSYVPADANKLVLTVPGKTVNGTFAVTDATDDYISAGTGNSTVTLNFTKGVFGTTATEFFFPVPVTTFSSGFTADFKNAANESLYSHSTTKKTISAARASIKRMADLTVPCYLYIKNDSGWSGSKKVYVWNSDDDSEKLAGWPGVDYDDSSTSFHHNDVDGYHRIDASSLKGKNIKVVFNMNSEIVKTPDSDIISFNKDIYLNIENYIADSYRAYFAKQSPAMLYHAWGDVTSTAWPGNDISTLSSGYWDGQTFYYIEFTKNQTLSILLQEKEDYFKTEDFNVTNQIFFCWFRGSNESSNYYNFASYNASHIIVN